MKQVTIVADDLTGALDAAARFTGACGPIAVLLDPVAGGLASGHRAMVVPTRDMSLDRAVAMGRASLAAWNGATVAFKKIDSLLRGHWAAEIAVSIQSGQFDRVILAPAFPALGRLVRSGYVHVVGKDGTAARVDVDMVAALRPWGVIAELVTEPARLVSARAPVLVADAADDQTLAYLAEAGSRLSGRTLWCGSAGLAGALAAVAPKTPPRLRSPLMAIVGTNHPVMQSQLRTLRDRVRFPEIRIADDPSGAAAEIAEGLRNGDSCIVTFDLPDGLDPAVAASRIDAAIRLLVPALQPPSTLFASGGETLLSIVQAAGANGLTVLGEALPGIPVSTINGGAWHGMPVISKSGAFGGPDTLLHLLADLAP